MGQLRILLLYDCPGGVFVSSVLGSSDRPSKTIRGTVFRATSGSYAYTCLGFADIKSDGSLSLSLATSYNTSTAITHVSSSDTSVYNGVITWLVP